MPDLRSPEGGIPSDLPRTNEASPIGEPCLFDSFAIFVATVAGAANMTGQRHVESTCATYLLSIFKYGHPFFPGYSSPL